MLELWQFWVAIVVVFILGFLLALKCSERYCEVQEEAPTRKKRRHATNTRESIVDSVKSLTDKDDYTPYIPKEVLYSSRREDVEIGTEVPIRDSHVKDYTPALPSIITDPEKRPASTKAASEPRSKGEKACKIALEKIYSPYKFHSTWPDWLRNPETGFCLELDLYNEELKLAVEYNGKQHYVYTPYFHKNGMKDFESQVRRDHHKMDLCDENGVWLIIVPYNVPEDKIEDYIRYYTPENVERRRRLGN